MVVLDHFVSLRPWEAQPHWMRPLFLSPLRVLAAGHEAVILFFLLSGFVLSLPYLRPSPPGYGPFLVRRVFRIYLPYVAALMLAVAADALFRAPVRGFAPWVDGAWSRPVDLRLVLQHLAFLGSYDYRQFNGAFWSLIQEMRISLVFPALAILTANLRPRTSITAAAAVSVAAQIMATVFGHWGWFRTAHYAAIFLLGCLIARNLDSISAWYRGLDRTARTAFALAALLLFVYGRQAERLGWARGRSEDWAVALGAAGLAILSLNAWTLRRCLRTSALQKLGAVSFSTYLVHVPILLALVHGLPGSTSWTTMLFLYATLTCVAALLFHNLIETPATRAGRRISGRIANHGSASAAPWILGRARSAGRECPAQSGG